MNPLEEEIERIREVRRRISAQCGDDPSRLIDYYRRVSAKLRASGQYKFAEPAPPKPREALKTAIRPPEQRPRDNWVVRIFDFLVRIAWRLLWSWRR